MKKLHKEKVIYIDLGLHEGNEISLFLHETQGLNVDIEIYGVEADPKYYKYCKERFKKDKRVKIFNLAIGSVEGTMPFFMEKTGEGSSLYSDKNNVSTKKITVPVRRFSTFFKQLPKADYYILKANIEGAEWDLIQDLDKERLFPRLAILCGSNSWVADMSKIPSLSPKIPDALAILERNGVVIKNYCALSPNYIIDTTKNVNMGIEILRLQSGSAQKNKLKILVTVIHQGWMRPEMFGALSNMFADPRATVKFASICDRPYENALNGARKLAKDGNYDFWFTFDHDNVPKRNVIDLAFLGRDIVGMPYIGSQHNNGKMELAFLAMDKKEDGKYLDHREMTGLQKVDAVASGALMLSKKVIDSPKVVFIREWSPEGFATRGVDFNFCDKAIKEGFDVFAHYDYPASHYKEIDLLTLV